MTNNIVIVMIVLMCGQFLIIDTIKEVKNNITIGQNK